MVWFWAALGHFKIFYWISSFAREKTRETKPIPWTRGQSDKLLQLLQVLRNFSTVPIIIVHHCQSYAISGSTWGDTIPEQHWTKQRTISKPELQLRVWRYSICAIVANANIFATRNTTEEGATAPKALACWNKCQNRDLQILVDRGEKQ